MAGTVAGCAGLTKSSMLRLPSARRSTEAFSASMVTLSATIWPRSSGRIATLTLAPPRLAASPLPPGSDSVEDGRLSAILGNTARPRSPSMRRVRW